MAVGPIWRICVKENLGMTKKVISIRFVCPECKCDKLVEQEHFYFDEGLNTFVLNRNKESNYFCLGCATDVEPALVDFELREKDGA